MTTNFRHICDTTADDDFVRAARGIPAQNDTPEYDPHRVIYVSDHEPGAIDRDLLAMFDKAWLWAAAACCVLVGVAIGWGIWG